MKHIKDYGFSPERAKEATRVLSLASGLVKIHCGVANNCCYVLMGNAFDLLKQHPRYKEKTKLAFKQVAKDWEEYERALLYAEFNRMFHVADMAESVRKKYGELTDKEYFEYWQGLGGAGYVKTQDQINVLRHKYRLALSSLNVPHEEILSYLLMTDACLRAADKVYQNIIDEAKELSGVPLNVIQKVFSRFRLTKVTECFEKAMMRLDPMIFEYDIDDFLSTNIDMALAQLEEKWQDTDYIMESAKTATKDFVEIFRNNKEFKDALKQLTKAKKQLKGKS